MSRPPAEAHAPAFSRGSATARTNAWGPYHGPPGRSGVGRGSPAPGRQAAGRPRDPRLRGWSRLRTRGRGVLLRLDRRKHQTRGPGVDAYPGAVADLAG